MPNGSRSYTFEIAHCAPTTLECCATDNVRYIHCVLARDVVSSNLYTTYGYVQFHKHTTYYDATLIFKFPCTWRVAYGSWRLNFERINSMRGIYHSITLGTRSVGFSRTPVIPIADNVNYVSIEAFDPHPPTRSYHLAEDGSLIED